MFGLRVVQAGFGDCLIVEHGKPAAPRYILIDGGTRTVYDSYLKPELQRIAAVGGKLEAVVASHIDTDHIVGLLAFTSELVATNPRFISIDSVWHNSFDRAIDPSGEIRARIESLNANAVRSMSAAGQALFGVKEGNKLRINTLLLNVPINPGFDGDLVSVDTSPAAIQFDDLVLHVVGPNEKNLENLRDDWKAWLDEHEDVLTSADPLMLAKADTTVPNLSSIMLLAEAGGKTMLLPGDGRGDHLIDGLRQIKRLNNGSLHVDLLKLPHHGSEANVSRSFFDTITADTYVASANGRYGNPDLATLIWIVEAAKAQARPIVIFVTNETPSTKALQRDYPASKYTYRLRVMSNQVTSEVISLA